MNVMSVSMRKALIIWEEYIEAKARNEELYLKSVSTNLKITSLYNCCIFFEPTSLTKYLI